MKKRSLKSLKLNKESVANLDQVKAGEEASLTSIIPLCTVVSTLSCVLICVTKLGPNCDKDDDDNNNEN
jgi:hypothetical protein